MNTFRNELKRDYTIIPNRVINDSRLSWKAKGIFCYLASKPDEWRFSMEQICEMAQDQMAALKSGVKELEQAGYLSRERIYGQDRKIQGWRWVVKLPSKNHQMENPPDGKTTGWETMRYSKTDYSKTDLSKTEENKNQYVRLRQTVQDFVDYWNEVYSTSVRYTAGKERQVKARLKYFSEQDLKQAILNRRESPFFAKAEGAKFLKDWDSFWRNDEKVERYLTAQAVDDAGDDDLPF